MRATLAVWILLLGTALGQRTPVNPILGPVPVIQVLDGDTVVLESNLGPRIVRLIGIDTPEVSHPEKGREPFGPEASEFTKAKLVPGTFVWVELDLESEDAYGRLLAYLYVADRKGSWQIGDQQAVMVNEEIAAAGFARVLTIEPNAVYADYFETAVAYARERGIGMWSATAASDQAMSKDVPSDELDSVMGGGASASIRISCARFDPLSGQDEIVFLKILEEMDTRGYYLHDQDGSGTRIRLPAGTQQPGVLEVRTEGQELWNNSGDTIYLKLGNDDTVIDEWNYRDRVSAVAEGDTLCR